MVAGANNRIVRLSSWQVLPMFAWLLFVLIAAEPLLCQSGCQYRVHEHATILPASGMATSGMDARAVTPIQAFICLLSDPLLPQDSQQPASPSNPSHEHIAVQILLVLMLTSMLVLGTAHLGRMLPHAWILAPLDRPPIHLHTLA